MNIKLWLALPAALAAFAVSQPASAAVVTYTYAGTIDFGSDGLGLFGAAGGSLNGAAFTAVFYRDDALALPENIVLGADGSYVNGEGLNAPVRAVLTIGETSYDIGGGYGEQTQYDDGAYESFGHSASGAGASISLGGNTLGTFGPSFLNYLAGPDYHSLTSLTAAQTPGYDWSGNFAFSAPDARGGQTFGRFNPVTLTVAGADGGGPGVVPEPGAWALMILGFGCAGHALRRRRGLALV